MATVGAVCVRSGRGTVVPIRLRDNISSNKNYSIIPVKMGEMLFTVFDYVLFGGMLVLSALVGIYFGFCSKTKQDNPMEYLLGSKSMKILPVAISLTAT